MSSFVYGRIVFLLALLVPIFTYKDIHPEHLPYYFQLFPNELSFCRNDVTCQTDISESSLRCWGYEDDCEVEKSFRRPVCNGDHRGWVRSKKDQLETFYAQADFGYIREHMNSIQVICEPTFRDDSVLECSDHLQFCRGRNLLINLTRLGDFGTWRYRMDVLQPGDIRGWCHLHGGRIENRSDHMSPLQSWAPEMRNFQLLPKQLQPEEDCDVYIEKPTFIMKIDATVNMYHHLCDFLNLYASLHLNNSHPDMFNRDVQIIIWETYPYYSSFRDMWLAFTKYPVKTIADYAGQNVCFKNVIFPLPPRMIFGLYYNTPLIYGCERSGMFKAFSQHILHRLNISSPVRNSTDVRITFLSRETSHRNIVNEKDLISALKTEPGVHVRRVVFNRELPFREQLEIISGTDLFIGMHGAGLTHLLFLPDWAAVFEVFNCEDESCYFDLARLRGVKYATWRRSDKMKSVGDVRQSDGTVHAKFTDYSFDKDEFMEIVRELVDFVRNNEDFKAEVRPSLRDEL